jgi:hypothetical protein
MKAKKPIQEKEMKNQKLANFIMKLHKEKLDTERTLCRILHYEDEYNLSEFLSFFQKLIIRFQMFMLKVSARILKWAINFLTNLLPEQKDE